MKQLIRDRIIEVSYNFSLERQYLIIRTLSENEISSDQFELFCTTKTRFFLPIQKVVLDNVAILHYEISEKHTLAKCLIGKVISFKFIITLIKEYIIALEEINKYNLSPQGIILDKEYIFFSNDNKKTFFLYLPIFKCTSNFFSLAEFLNDLCLYYTFDFNISWLEEIITLTYKTTISFIELKESIFELEKRFKIQETSLENEVLEENILEDIIAKKVILGGTKESFKYDLFEKEENKNEVIKVNEYIDKRNKNINNSIIAKYMNLNIKCKKLCFALIQVAFFIIIISVSKIGIIGIFTSDLIPKINFVIFLGIVSFWDYLIFENIFEQEEDNSLNEALEKKEDMLNDIYPHFIHLKRGKKIKTYINKPVFIIGCSEEVDYICKSEFIDEEHAEILTYDDKYFIKDLNSQNGVVLNDDVLMGNIEYQIFQDDVFELGDIKFIFYEQ